MSIRYQFAVLHQSPRHGLGLRHRSLLGDWPRLVPFGQLKEEGEAMSRPVVKKKQSKRKRKMSEATAACGGGANEKLIGKTEKVSRRRHRWAQRKEKPMEEKDVVYVTFTEEDLQEAWRLPRGGEPMPRT